MWVEKITSLFLTHSARQPCTSPLVHEIIIKWCWTKRKCTMHFNDDAEVTAPKYKSNLRCFCGFFSKDIPWFTSFSFYQLDFVFSNLHTFCVYASVSRFKPQEILYSFFFQICFIYILWKRYGLPWRILAFVPLKYVCYLEHCIHIYLKNNISKICNR